jgi:isochorismate synthase
MTSTTSVSTKQKTETEILDFLLNHALENDLPIAVWRLPNASVRYLIISQEYHYIEKNTTLEELPAGFIFAPFEREKPGLFLPGDFIFTFENNLLREPQTPAEISSAAWLDERLKTTASLSKGVKFKFIKSNQSETPPDNFIPLVGKCVAAIEMERFEKIVPSRTRLVTLPDDFDIVACFEKLCERYPNALVSFVSIPGIGSWLGASPEALVTVENKTIFKTVALAGTKPFNEGMNLKSVAWTQKEIEEHALVERYVVSCFKKIRIREYEEHGPKTIVAGNLVHLKSDFIVDMKATNFPQLGSVMLQLLHPTAAVCGMPLESAQEFLKEHEGYDREFYSGYLGPVSVDSDIHIFVNIRCMKLLDDKALLFAGAGVTIDSIPEKEWEETEMKFNTLLNIIL